MEAPTKTLNFGKSMLLIVVVIAGGLTLVGMLAEKKENAAGITASKATANPNQKRDINGYRLGMPKAEVMKQSADTFRSPCAVQSDSNRMMPNTFSVYCPDGEKSYQFTFTDKHQPSVLMEVQLDFRAEAKFDDVLKTITDQFGKQPDAVVRPPRETFLEKVAARDSATFDLGRGDKLGLRENNIVGVNKTRWRLLLINDDLFAREKDAIEKAKRAANPIPKL